MRFARGCGGWDSAATKLFSLAAPEFAREAARRGSQVYRFREGVRHGSLEQAAAGSIEPETHLSGCKWNQQLAGEFWRVGTRRLALYQGTGFSRAATHR